MSLVHQTSSLDDIARFHYLLSFVSGFAASVVKLVPLTATNYPIDWKALKVRFENQRILTTAHVDHLFCFKPIAHESLTFLTLFINTIQGNIAVLKDLGVTKLVGFLLFRWFSSYWSKNSSVIRKYRFVHANIRFWFLDYVCSTQMQNCKKY